MPGANRATQVFNFYESTIANADFSAGASSFSVASTPTVDGTNGITSATTSDADTWIYLVIDPDSSSNREIVIVKTHTSGSTSFSDVERDYDGRQEAAGAAADTGISHGIGTTVRMAVLAEHILDQNERVAANITSLDTAISDFNTNSAAAITTFNTNGTNAINDINASSATSMVDNATSGTSIEVDIDNDFMLVYDATDSTSKKVYANQTNKELKGYKETDVALTSTSGVVAIDLNNGNTGSLTLTENVTDIDFTNVPANGVGTFTLKITQDSSTAYTVAINAITVNGSGHQTAKTPFGGSGYTMTATTSRTDILGFLFFDASTDIYLNALQDFN